MDGIRLHAEPGLQTLLVFQFRITLVDPNDNYHNGGIATSDISGTYSLEITPDMTPVPGKYTVIATFAGSNAYYPSYAESTFVVDPPPAATTAPTATPTSVADMYFVPAIAGIFVLIIVVAISTGTIGAQKKTIKRQHKTSLSPF